MLHHWLLNVWVLQYYGLKLQSTNSNIIYDSTDWIEKLSYFHLNVFLLHIILLGVVVFLLCLIPSTFIILFIINNLTFIAVRVIVVINVIPDSKLHGSKFWLLLLYILWFLELYVLPMKINQLFIIGKLISPTEWKYAPQSLALTVYAVPIKLS